MPSISADFPLATENSRSVADFKSSNSEALLLSALENGGGGSTLDFSLCSM